MVRPHSIRRDPIRTNSMSMSVSRRSPWFSRGMTAARSPAAFSRGGPSKFPADPWVVTGNQHDGAFASTFAPSAFGFNNPHDLTFDSNIVSQQDSNGHVFRLDQHRRLGF